MLLIIAAMLQIPVNVTLINTKPGRPPLERLIVNVEITNDGSTPRWALIPTSVPETAGGGIDKLEEVTGNIGTTRIAVGRFLGTGGRYAVRLAPGAHVTLRNLEIRWWQPSIDARDLQVEIQLADEVTLGAQAMSTWFSQDPTVRGNVQFDMATARDTASHRAPNDKEVKVSVTSPKRTSIKLSVP